ncbi:MAG: site-specific integrase [Polyangia bacterium]|jgi:integrase
MARKKRKRPSGQGCVYQRGPGNFWIKWREGGRRHAKGGYPTEKEAKDVLAKITADVRAGRDGMPHDIKNIPTLGSLGDEWVERRQLTHRSYKNDRNRWRKDLKPFFGGYQPYQVDGALIRRFIEQKLGEGLCSTTVGHLVRGLSTFFADVVEKGLAAVNPVATLPRSTRRLYRNAKDPRTTPFLEKLEDVRRVFLALPRPYNVAFAVGALAGLRTGEVLGLDWHDVDLANRRIYVRQQVHEGQLGPLKDDESRVVPLLKPLAPILAEWKLATGGVGLVFPPRYPKRGGRPGKPAAFTRPNTLWRHLDETLKACMLPPLTWYQATRHTFASQFVLGGGSIEKLSKIMGHASVTTTERYAHLRTDLFRESDFDVVAVDLSTPMAEVVPLPAKTNKSGTFGHAVVTTPTRKKEEAALTG